MNKPSQSIDTTSPEFRAGALAGLEAVKRLQRARFGGDISIEQYYANRDSAAAAIIEAAGPVTDRAAGALALLAEFMVDLQDAGENIADTWQPETLMTPDQREAARQEFILAINESARSNVVQLRQ